MEGSNSYRFPKLKGSENYESWRVDAISALKAKGLWFVTSGKLKKPKSRNNSRFRKRSNKTCSHCEKMGHSKQNCWYLKPELRPEGWKPSQEKKDPVTDSGKSSGARIVRSMKVSFACRAGSRTNAWWIDTGAEDHVCYDEDLFEEQSYRKVTGNSIVTANNEAVAIVGKGSVIIDILLKGQPTKIRLTNVYHCPGLHYNLMSVGQVEAKGYTCSMKDGKFRFMDSKGAVALIGSRNEGGAYFVDTPTNPPNSRSVTLASRTGSAKASWRQWHKRLAHLNMADVKRLANMSTGIDVDSANSLENEESPESVCGACAIGKQNRTPSRKPHTRATKVGELVHTDLAGGGKIPKTDGGSRYVATMIDDYSQYTTTYLLERKSDLKGVLRKYLEFMKTQGTPVHRLRSDNGGEYAGHQTIELLEEHGVKWEPTAPYNPSQNGVAERCFRTLFERTRAILTSAKLPIRLWGEAIMTVTYLKNRSPTTALDKITPYEAWHGKKPDLSYLHTFGCIAYHHVEGARRKLDDKSLKCQFLGYEGVNQFRLWNGKNVLISSHVQWDEVVTESGGYDEDLSVLISFDDQTDDAPSPIKTTENAEIAEIADDHQTRTPAAPQKARSRPLELESSEPDSSSDSDAPDASDAPSGRPKRAIAGPVDYRALNDPWAKGHNRGFASRANRVQIESDTPQTVEQARASPDREQWELACRSELDAHIKNDTFVESANPTPDHDLAVKQIIRYLAGTAQLGLRYGPSKVEGVGGAEFFGYTDSAHADCLDSRKSTSGYMFFLWNGPISWSSKRQQCVSTSSAEAEYVGECSAAKEVTFLVQALKEVGYEGSDTNPTTILADNQAAIKMGSNPVNHPGPSTLIRPITMSGIR